MRSLNFANFSKSQKTQKIVPLNNSDLKVHMCKLRFVCFCVVRVECLPKAGNWTCDCENITVPGMGITIFGVNSS